MSELNLSPKQKALRKAVAEYCEKSGINAVTLSIVTEKFVGMLSARWEHICDVALADENEGKVGVSIGIAFDMTHKMPVGTMSLRFQQVTKDDCDFQIPDPDQPPLPFAEAVREVSNPRRRAQSPSGQDRTSQARGTQVSQATAAAPTPEPSQSSSQSTPSASTQGSQQSSSESAAGESATASMSENSPTRRRRQSASAA